MNPLPPPKNPELLNWTALVFPPGADVPATPELPVRTIVAIPVIDSNSPEIVIPYPTKLICVPIPNRLLVPDAAPVEMPILGLASKVNVAIPTDSLNALVTVTPAPTKLIWVASPT